ELGDSGMGAEHQPLEVDVDDAGLVLDRDVPEQAERTDADVVDPDVDTAMTVERRAGDGGDLVGLADVTGNGQGVPAGGADFALDLGKQSVAPGGQDDAGALAGQFEGDPAAQAAGGP